MAIVERSQETKASPQTIWRIWSDVSTWKDWNPNVRSMSLNGPFASGTTGTMVTGQGQHPITLEDVTPGKSFRLETTVVPLTRFSFECAITPGGGGTTTISQGIRVKGPLGGIVGPMMGRQVAASFPTLLKGLATTAEASEART
jgi:polyketide cyclase/dehydrase/lipid transport protein